MNESLETFGRIVARQGRDQGLDELEMMLSGRAKAPTLSAISERLHQIDAGHHDAIRAAVRASIDAAIHGLLFKLYEDEKVQLIVDGVNLRNASDGFHGDYLTGDGWIGRYSKHPE